MVSGLAHLLVRDIIAVATRNGEDMPERETEDARERECPEGKEKLQRAKELMQLAASVRQVSSEAFEALTPEQLGAALARSAGITLVTSPCSALLPATNISLSLSLFLSLTPSFISTSHVFLLSLCHDLELTLLLFL